MNVKDKYKDLICPMCNEIVEEVKFSGRVLTDFTIELETYGGELEKIVHIDIESECVDFYPIGLITYLCPFCNYHLRETYDRDEKYEDERLLRIRDYHLDFELAKWNYE